MSCNKIHYFSLSLSPAFTLFLSSSLGDNVSLLRRATHRSPLLPLCGARGPCLSSTQVYNSHAPLHSSFHYQKPNPLTAPHKREIQSVYHLHNGRYEPGLLQRDIQYRQREKDRQRSWSVFLYFNGYTKKRKNGKMGLKLLSFSFYHTNKPFLFFYY